MKWIGKTGLWAGATIALAVIAFAKEGHMFSALIGKD